MKSSILIMDDELSMCTLLSLALGQEYDVRYATTAQEGLKLLEEGKIDLVLLDLMLGGSDGIDVLRQIKKRDSSVTVIMMTAYGSIPTSVEAIRSGAFTYLVKPLDIEELNVFIQQALSVKKLNDQCEYLTEELKNFHGCHQIIGESPEIRKVFHLIEKLKDVDTSVLIYGESGTGKELAAQALHQSGRRSANRFVAINCAAIPEELLEEELFGHKKGAFTGAVQDKKGKFEMADKGTIFLDEIGDMPLRLQGKLLRVLQQKECSRIGSNEVRKLDVRVVAATNRNLEEMVRQGAFREDLYYRLNVVSLVMPPLRERRGDIPLLGGHFLRQFEKEQNREHLSISPEAMEILTEYSYPGNVRQLANILEYAVILSPSGHIEAEDLPDAVLKDRRQRTGGPGGAGFEPRGPELRGMVRESPGREGPDRESLVREGPGGESLVREGPGGAGLVREGLGGERLSREGSGRPGTAESELAEQLGHMTLREVEELMIREALKRNEGRRASTAKELGISMRGLYNKIQEYGL